MIWLFIGILSALLCATSPVRAFPTPDDWPSDLSDLSLPELTEVMLVLQTNVIPINSFILNVSNVWQSPLNPLFIDFISTKNDFICKDKFLKWDYYE